jgi:hypothetical protein
VVAGDAVPEVRVSCECGDGRDVDYASASARFHLWCQGSDEGGWGFEIYCEDVSAVIVGNGVDGVAIEDAGVVYECVQFTEGGDHFGDVGCVAEVEVDTVSDDFACELFVERDYLPACGGECACGGEADASSSAGD